MASADKWGDFVRQLSRPASGANPPIPGQVLKLVGANMGSLNRINPDLAARIANGDSEAVFEAYRMIVSKGDALARRGGAQADAVMDPEYADVLGMDAPSTRQLELPLADEPRGMVPFGSRGDGMPVGGVRGPGAAVGGVGGPGVRQGGMIPSSNMPPAVAGSRGMSAGGERGMSVPEGASPGWRQLAGYGGGPPGVADDVIDAEFEVLGRQRNFPGGGRNLPPPVKDASGRWVYPAMGVAALGGAAALAAREMGDAELEAGGMDTAELAAESRPGPSVGTQEEAPLVDYSAMAREKIRQANEIQLREGRVTPESAALAREADALYQKAAEGRRSGSQPPIMPVGQQNAQTSAIRAQSARQAAANPGSDYRSLARRMLADLNARASEGTLTNGERQQMMAEINRLYALADEQANQRRAG